jgi:protein-arginine deiminase
MSRNNIGLSRRHRGNLRLSAALAACAALVAGAAAPAIAATTTTAPVTGVLLLADTNRDGLITAADVPGKDSWTEDRGTFFLPNLDDDDERCPVVAADGSQLSDVQLASCNDAADDVVNGDYDVLDLARLVVQPATSAAAESIQVSLLDDGAAKARVFVKTGDGEAANDWTVLPAGGLLPQSAVTQGAELGIEGKDIIRDASWDGVVKVRVTHLGASGTVATDSVALRVTPLLFQTDLMPVQQLFAADNATSVYANRGPIEPTTSTQRILLTQVPFRADIAAGIERIGEDKVEFKLLPSLEGARGGGTGTDVWSQDIMEPGFMTIATPQGEHGMAVFVRAPVRDGRDNAGSNPFRQTGRVIFT